MAVSKEQFSRGATLGIVRTASLVCVVCVVGSVVASAAPPTVANLSLRGLQTGATTTLAIDGANLLPDPRLLLPVSGVKQTVRPGATATHVEFDVSLDAAIPPGIYNLRVASAGGVSPPAAIGLDSLAERAMTRAPSAADSGEPAGSPPTAFSGSLSGDQTANTVVSLKKGERIVVEVEARRLGSPLDPVLHVYDRRDVPLAWAEGTTPLGGDARLSFVAPADGPYRVELHDAVFRAEGKAFYRLKIGSWYYAGMVFPPVVQRGTKAVLEFADTNLPPGTKVELNMPADAADMPAPWPDGQRPDGQRPEGRRPEGERMAGFRPVVLASDVPEIVQSPQKATAAGAAQEVVAPAGISGRLTAAKEDTYRVAVEPNMRLRFEVLAARIGSPLDCELSLRDEHGGQLAGNDDQPGTVDPGLDFTVPANMHTLVVAVKDVSGRGGPDCIYHVAISRLDQPNFTLSLADDQLEIPPGGIGLMRIAVQRTNYSGPIELSLHGLPPGVGVNEAVIEAGSDEALVSLPAAVGPPAAAIVSITATASESPARIFRSVELPAAGATVWQPWLRSELAVARTGPPAIALAWAGSTATAAEKNAVNNSASSSADNAEAAVRPGEKVPLAVHFNRAAAAGPAVQGAVRLSLVSSQPMPEKKIRVKLKNRKTVEQEVADPKRALRLEGAAVIPASKSDATAQLVIPGDLRASEYELALRGDVLDASGQNIVSTTYTRVMRITVAPKPAEPKEAQPAKSQPKAAELKAAQPKPTPAAGPQPKSPDSKTAPPAAAAKTAPAAKK